MSAAAFILATPLLLALAAPAEEAGAPAASTPTSDGTSDGTSDWTSGPDAPAPSSPSPWPQGPREPGAAGQQLEMPAAAPEPARPVLDLDIGPPLADPRLSTTRARDALWARGALDLDTALVDVAGLWLRHEQGGSSRAVARGRAEPDVAVILDDVPVFDLRGLVPALELFPPASLGRLTWHHGPRAVSAAAAGAAGVLELSSLDADRDQGEGLRLRGVLGGGYGGADLEKGVFTAVETGFDRTRVGLHATLLNREDQRLGRGLQNAPGAEPGGLVLRSGGSGGAVGARVDVVPWRSLHVFTTWHSARTIEAPRPELCLDSDDFGRPLDCTRTTERGLDAWIVGADQGTHLGGASLVLRGRAHAQHALAHDQRTGSGIEVADTLLDDGVRAGGRASAELSLPAVALLDVWVPRAELAADVYGDRVTSQFFSRSTRQRDAEPPGLGLADPARARLQDPGAPATSRFSSLSLRLRADGARSLLWADGRVASSSLGPGPGDGLAGELGARGRLWSPLWAFAVLVHRPDDDTAEAGLSLSIPWLDVDGAVWGSARGDGTAWGAEARGVLRPGVEGLSAAATLAAIVADHGGLFDVRTPAANVVNPAGTLTIDYAPAALPGGFFVRTRALFPQQRLSPDEEADPVLCPERPTDEQLAAGALQQTACRGAPGTFLLDVGARLELGRIAITAVAENLLDQQGALRDEPIGLGGTTLRCLLTLGL